MVTATIQRKLEELGYSIKRNASYFFIYNSESEYIKTCHGFRSLSEYVCREYSKIKKIENEMIKWEDIRREV